MWSNQLEEAEFGNSQRYSKTKRSDKRRGKGKGKERKKKKNEKHTKTDGTSL